MSWSLRSVTGNFSYGPRTPSRRGRRSRPKNKSKSIPKKMKMYDTRSRNWWDQTERRSYGGYAGSGSPRERTIADNMFTGTAVGRPPRGDISLREAERGVRDAYHGGKELYRGGKKAHGLIRAGIRSLKGKQEGYRLVYSEGKGGQEFVETYRSFRHAEAAAEKMRAKGWQAVVKPA